MLSSLKSRFAVGAFILLALLMTTTGVWIYVWTEQRLNRELEDSLLLTAQGAASQAALERGFIELYHHKLKQFEENREFLFLQMLNRKGGIIYGSKEEYAGIEYQPTPEKPNSFTQLKFEDKDALVLKYTFEPLDEYIRATKKSEPYHAAVIVATDLAPLHSTLSDLKQIILLSTLSCAIIGAVFLGLLAAYSTRPIDELAQEIQSIDHRTMDAQISIPRLPKEAAPVVDEFNDLMTKLKAAFERERTFTSNVSHELRTPLTGLRTTLEVALTSEESFQSNRHAQQTCLNIVKQTQSLVEKLLNLTRLESGGLTHPEETIDLKEHVESILDTFGDIAQKRRIEILLEIPDSVQVTLPSDLFTMLLNNLIENAVNYCNDQGQIQIDFIDKHSTWELRIENTGCVLTQEDLTHVFEPFWRHDTSRTATGTHAGLGMSIAKAMAENCKLSLTVNVQDDRFQACIASNTQCTADSRS